MTAITEIQRSGAKAARGLVSIQSRYNQILDDTSSTGQKLIAFYDEHSIQLYDQEGQLRSLWETLSDVAKIWDTLDENEQKYFLNIQAGANQSVQLGALMGNFQTAIEATETALNSAGSAMRENESYMQSLNARTDLLKSTFQTLANDVIPKELIAKGLDVLDKFLKLLDTDLGVVLTRITMLTGIGWGFSSLANASKILPTVISQFDKFAKLLSGAAIDIPKAAQEAGGLIKTMAVFHSTALPIIGVLALLGTAAYEIVKRIKENKARLDELVSSANNFNTTIKEVNKNATEEKAKIEATTSVVGVYIKRIEELDKKTSLNNAEQIEYHSLLQKIVEVMPSVASSIDLQNKKIIGGTSALYDQIEAWKDLAKQQAYQSQLSSLYAAQTQIDFQIAENQIKLQQAQANLEAARLMPEGKTRSFLGAAYMSERDLAVASASQEVKELENAISDLEKQRQESDSKIQAAANTLADILGASSDTDTSDYPHRDRTPTGEGKEIRRRGRVGEETEETAEQAVEETGTTTSNVISSIEEQIEEIVFNLQDFISLSQSEIDLLESEYSLMEAQGASSEELNAKIKEIQDAYHAEAEILRTILSRAEEYNLTQEEINDIQTEINNRSIDWWNWQNKINKLLKDAETSTENIEENVDDIYTRYEEGIAKLREEERERAANYKDDETYQYWNLQIQLIDEYIAELQKSNQQLNEQLKLQEKLDNLARAKESRLLVYKDGSYQYIEDVDAVSKAARELSDVQREQALAKTIEDLEYTKSAYQAMVGAVEEGMMGFPSWANTYLRKLDRQGGWQEVFGYAGGTTNASGGLSLVGEKGAELRILNKGDGILPSNLTENLMRWGQMTPNQFKSNSIGGFGNNMAVTIQALNLPNVSNGADFVNYIKNHMFGQVLNLVH